MRTILFSLLGLALFLGIAGCTKNAESMDSMKMSNASPKADASMRRCWSYADKAVFTIRRSL